jgi:5-methylcytosine-specific restriction endonuclease McrA
MEFTAPLRGESSFQRGRCPEKIRRYFIRCPKDREMVKTAIARETQKRYVQRE